MVMPIRVEITSILKKAIFTHEYNAGDELSLTDIAERLGVSRTPVREAFQSLSEEGLITLRMNRGAIVNKIDRKFVKDSFEMNKSKYEKLNKEIHMRIWNAADNDKLKRYLLELWNGPNTGHSIDESLLHYKNSTFEHISILHFIRDHKPEETRKVMIQHITRSMGNILKRYPE